MKRYLALCVLQKRFWHLPCKRVLMAVFYAKNRREAVELAQFRLVNNDLWNYDVYRITETKKARFL